MKTYVFPKKGGGTVTKTLAISSPARMERFLQAFGKSSYSEFDGVEGDKHYSLTVLSTATNRELLVELMTTCLQEGSNDIDFDYMDFDLTVSDGAIQDFFDCRARKLRERLAT